MDLALRFGQFMVGWPVFWRGTQCARRNLSLSWFMSLLSMWVTVEKKTDHCCT